MRHETNRFFRLTTCLLVVLCCLPASPVESAEQDFLFLEMERALREEPASPKTPARLFAVGEYLFDMKRFPEAADCFRKAEKKPLSAVQTFLSKVYLAEIARLVTGDTEPAELADIKESLAERNFFTMSGKTKKQVWRSLLHNRYEVVESVDRIDVYRNGSVFYVVSLP